MKIMTTLDAIMAILAADRRKPTTSATKASSIYRKARRGCDVLGLSPAEVNEILFSLEYADRHGKLYEWIERTTTDKVLP